MYNRYIPQPDGTYRRNRIQDMAKLQEPPTPDPPPQPIPAPPPEIPRCSNCVHARTHRKPAQNREYRPKEQTSITGFLKQLLPKDFDVEDLMVVLLLLLMAGDSQENQNTALLTLVLYLFV